MLINFYFSDLTVTSSHVGNLYEKFTTITVTCLLFNADGCTKPVMQTDIVAVHKRGIIKAPNRSGVVWSYLLWSQDYITPHVYMCLRATWMIIASRIAKHNHEGNKWVYYIILWKKKAVSNFLLKLSFK